MQEAQPRPKKETARIRKVRPEVRYPFTSFILPRQKPQKDGGDLHDTKVSSKSNPRPSPPLLLFPPTPKSLALQLHFPAIR
ncbi:hypothetical protein CKAH01_17796 [Colletotrichum kahawae]|uniref:Uncharacterized protein n=1 Tax=Colletotrichum kahawae TaxID=34407 RepID=A0AAE0D317_COLKA|nr:hypothetical protein CKAH01_17796 [Colletotrichum kahawae]